MLTILGIIPDRAQPFNYHAVTAALLMFEIIEKQESCLCNDAHGHYLCIVKKRNTMKALKQLFFDKELVEAIKVSRADQEVLYLQLINGKITMKEYIAANTRKAS